MMGEGGDDPASPVRSMRQLTSSVPAVGQEARGNRVTKKNEQNHLAWLSSHALHDT
jgi:hypothetical protein